MGVKMIADFRRKPSRARQLVVEQEKRREGSKPWVAFDPGLKDHGVVIIDDLTRVSDAMLDRIASKTTFHEFAETYLSTDKPVAPKPQPPKPQPPKSKEPLPMLVQPEGEPITTFRGGKWDKPERERHSQPKRRRS